MDVSILIALERAELAARERRLAAEAEAEGILEAARVEARAIEAGVESGVAAALAELRAGLIGRAREEAAGVEAEIEALAGSNGTEAADRAARARFEQAVARIVAAVLGEPEG